MQERGCVKSVTLCVVLILCSFSDFFSAVITSNHYFQISVLTATLYATYAESYFCYWRTANV